MKRVVLSIVVVYELNKLYLNKSAIGGFSTAVYLSSTEYNGGEAWGQVFLTGVQTNYFKYSNYHVRAIRFF
jgi:hypothetical protein